MSLQRHGLHVQKVWTNVTDESQRVSQALFRPPGLQGELRSSSPVPDASSSPGGILPGLGLAAEEEVSL